MRHTPGPWIVSAANGGADVSLYGHTAIHKNPVWICRVYGPGRLSNDTEKRDANASLIAAAPELYAALKDLIEFRDNGTPVHPGSLVWESAVSALRKAEGKEGDE